MSDGFYVLFHLIVAMKPSKEGTTTNIPILQIGNLGTLRLSNLLTEARLTQALEPGLSGRLTQGEECAGGGGETQASAAWGHLGGDEKTFRVRIWP